jgi:hypothetical protein
MIIEEQEMATKRDRTAAALAGGTLILRTVFLLRRPPWFDEIFTQWIARQAPARIVAHLRLDSGPPLFYLLATPFVRMGEILHFPPAARLLSFAAIGLLFFAAIRPRYSAGPRFAILLAASPLLFFYSGEARQYALLAAASFGLFLAALRSRDTSGFRLAAALAAAVLPWIHYLGLFVVAGSLLICAIRKRWASAALQLAGACLFLAWLPVTAIQPSFSIAWNRSAASSLLRAPQAFGFWGEVPGYFSAWRPPAAGAGIAIGIALLASAAMRARKSRAVCDALAFSFLPLALVFFANIFRPIYFPGRTEMATLPVALWALARASRRSLAANALTIAASVAGFAVIAGAFVHPPGPYPYSETAKLMVSRTRPGDLVVAADANYLPLRIEKDRGELAASLVGVPFEIESHPGWFEPVAPSRIGAETNRARRAVAAVPSGGRVDFAIPPDPVLRDLAERSLPGDEPRRVFQPPGGYAILEIDR